MKKDDTTKIFSADPVMDEENPWHYEETDNTANLISPLSNVDLTLRKLIPAMQNDVRLLRSIDEGIADDANTGMFITLKENADQVSTWYIEFQVSGKEQHKTYLVWVSAEDAARPMFKVVRKK